MKIVLIFLVILVAVDNAIGQRRTVGQRRNRRPPIETRSTQQRSSLPPCQCSGKPGEGPNAVTVNVVGSRPCRGAIVSQKHIAVPASCVYGKQAQKLNIQPSATVEYYTIYEGYCHVSGQKNIALIKVRDDLRVSPACLPSPLKTTDEHVSLFTSIGASFRKQGEVKKLLQWIQDLLMAQQERMCS